MIATSTVRRSFVDRVRVMRSALFELVEHPRDVRCARDQPFRKRRASAPARGAAPEQAEQVVLLGRQVEAGKEFVLDRPEAVVGSPEGEVRLLLGRIESSSRAFQG